MSEWRRFERGSRGGTADQFWSVRLRGRVCEMRSGWIDDPPSEETREYARASMARSAVKQKIRSRLRRGWVEVEEADEERRQALARAEPLEQAIAARPTKLDNWAVYADFLQQCHPVLGERLGLDLALAQAESEHDRARLQAKIEELERTHARELLGVTLAGALPHARFEPIIELERRFGMIVEARLHGLSSDMIKYDALVRALLELPAARVLLGLHLTIAPGTYAHMRTTELLLARPRPTLRRLTLGYANAGCAIYDLPLPPLQALLERVSELEWLDLHGCFRGPAAHSKLRALRFGRGRDDGPIPKLSSWCLPALETLHLIDCGRVDWSRVELPRLERLLIDWLDHGDSLVASLARAPLLRQLRSLVIVGSDLSGRGVRTLVEHAEAFAHVREIIVLDAYVERPHVDQLHQHLPNVRLGVDPGAHDPEGVWAPSDAEYAALTRF